MSIPNTNSGWGLQDVVDAVNPLTDDLISCIEDSVPEYFDPLYKGNKTSLLNFRNYITPYITLNYSSLIFDGNGFACTSSVINVSANTSWSATTNNAFISMIPTSGSGSRNITVTCSANPDAFERLATITIQSTDYLGINDTCGVTQLETGGFCS